MPGGAPELAVGRVAQPYVALHLHCVADRLVLRRMQLVVADFAGGVILTRLQQLGRTEQAAYVVGAERWLGTC